MTLEEMAIELAAMAQPEDDVCEAGFACGWVAPYGFVPEADCPVHDAPDAGPTSSGLPSSPEEKR